MKKKGLTALFLILAILAAAAAGCTLGDAGEEEKKPEKTVDNTEYVNVCTALQNTELPMMQSDLENIFYTLDTKGSVTFYEYANQAFQEIPATGSIQVTPQCSGDLIPATLTYLNRDGRVTGYGLFTPEATGVSFARYDYFFLNMRNLPYGFPDEDGTQFLLLMDGDKADFYNPVKTYEESFFLEPNEADISQRTNKRGNQFLDQVNRDLDPATGANETDFAVLTDDVLACAGNGHCIFFSGRQYAVTDPNKGVDLYPRSKGNAIGTPLYRNVSYFYAYETTDGVSYLRKTDTGFGLYRGNTLLHEFTGDYETQYLRSGNYLYAPAENTVYHLLTGAATPLQGVSPKDTVLFSVSPDGTKFIIAGMLNESPTQQSITFYNATENRGRTVEGSYLFSRADTNFAWLDNDTYFHNCASAEQTYRYSGRVFDWAGTTV